MSAFHTHAEIGLSGTDITRLTKRHPDYQEQQKSREKESGAYSRFALFVGFTQQLRVEKSPAAGRAISRK